MKTEEALATLHPIVAFRARRHIELCALEGIEFGITQGFRTWAQQQAYYDQVPKVTNARPGWSWHNWLKLGKALAYDGDILNFPGDTTPRDVYDGPWARVGLLGEQLGMLWGGRWKHSDLPHFEEHLGFTLQGLLRAYPGGQG